MQAFISSFDSSVVYSLLGFTITNKSNLFYPFNFGCLILCHLFSIFYKENILYILTFPFIIIFYTSFFTWSEPTFYSLFFHFANILISFNFYYPVKKKQLFSQRRKLISNFLCRAAKYIFIQCFFIGFDCFQIQDATIWDFPSQLV